MKTSLSILAFIVLIEISDPIQAQNKPTNKSTWYPANIQMCFEGTWGQTGLSDNTFDPNISWIIKFVNIPERMHIFVLRSDGQIQGDFYAPISPSSAETANRWTGIMFDRRKIPETVFEDIILLSDFPKCRTMTMSGGNLAFSIWNNWVFRRFPNDPTTLEGPLKDPRVVQDIRDGTLNRPKQPEATPQVAAAPKSSPRLPNRSSGTKLPSTPAPAAGPHVEMTYDRPPLGKHGMCDQSSKIGLRNFEGYPVTVTYHIRRNDNGNITEANNTVHLRGRGSLFLGCTTGQSDGHLFQLNTTIVSKAFAK